MKIEIYPKQYVHVQKKEIPLLKEIQSAQTKIEKVKAVAIYQTLSLKTQGAIKTVSRKILKASCESDRSLASHCFQQEEIQDATIQMVENSAKVKKSFTTIGLKYEEIPMGSLNFIVKALPPN